MDIFRINLKEIVRVLLVLAGIVLAILSALHYSHSVSRQLRVRQIPQLPDGAEILGQDSGGLLAAWLLIATKMDRESYAGYQRIVRDESNVILKIPEAARIGRSDDRQDGATDGRQLKFKQSVNGRYFSWWTIDAITHGEIDERQQGPDSRYSIYFDDDRSLVFIYWCDG